MRRMTTIHRRRALAAGSLAGALAVGSLAAAGPVFAEPGDGAELPAQGIVALDDSTTPVDLTQPGSMDSVNMELLANIPKNGHFTAESAYSSDMAFQGDYAFAGNYNGFTVYDVSDPAAPEQVVQVLCPGSQNDISVYGDILVLSTDSRRTNDSCENQGVPGSDTTSPYWEGLKIFDVSDPTAPEYVTSVETACGSHTHSLAPSKDGRTLYAYVSSYSPNVNLVNCQPPHDLISIVKIPVKAPETAEVVATPVLFPDGGYEGAPGKSATSGCHDITTYVKLDLAAGACMGDGILMDISDRENPVVISSVRDTENFAFWHSATFNNDGTKVVFTDELGGGGAATCNPTVGEKRGANAIYDIVDGELEFRSYYKIRRTNTNTENCVAHNGSLIPVKGKDIMVQAWYQGGISVFDFTDSEKPTEIAWFDRGPLSNERLILGGSWSAYYYNGYVYSNDIQQGFDVLRIADAAGVGKQKPNTYKEFNPQQQIPFHG
ncbi:LVIVD repeat-containing protein [Isoptericola variabilis J7]|uniref:LVIVD repeat-containing protein n=2 Tax=Isoptericola TaxID=254250 RepID=F6FW67_ISOV2|nr:LVIVD repeat-containing protein [Isoptericola variabilis 225]TWH25780.1 LVIVD repeat-containing protein [Isoptericola variabilis J7]